MFTLASPVWELARDLRGMLELNNFPDSLDAAPLRHWLPGWQDTPRDEIIQSHLSALRLQGRSMSTQTGK